MKFTSTPLIVAAIAGGMAVLPAVSAAPRPNDADIAPQNAVGGDMPEGIPPVRGMGDSAPVQTTGFSSKYKNST